MTSESILLNHPHPVIKTLRNLNSDNFYMLPIVPKPPTPFLRIENTFFFPLNRPFSYHSQVIVDPVCPLYHRRLPNHQPLLEYICLIYANLLQGWGRTVVVWWRGGVSV